ncbi:uncharacterized protein LOC114348597 isoform X4 [Diabrotica virgifera virgifera]|uniref:Uncharacterized protein n=1 Tax=Diabrotica virgifera virgifera TaxID=50390 RepID=A0ABM5J023_DIAVI|nr:uncharacterized protein LOC114348597 isoform X4 [Diabrotica virgifera virgifera]
MTKLLMVFIAVFVAVLADTAEDQQKAYEIYQMTVKKSKEDLAECVQELGRFPSYVNEKGKYFKNVNKKEREHIGELYLCAYKKLGIMTENGDILDDKFYAFLIDVNGDSNDYRDSRKAYIEQFITRCRPPKRQGLTPAHKVFIYESCLRNGTFVPSL